MNNPYFLIEKDFHSPLLWKIYKYMKTLQAGEKAVVEKRITYYFNYNELNIIINNIKKYDEIIFKRYFDEGYGYNGYYMSFYQRALPNYYGSDIQKFCNTIEEYVFFWKSIKLGEIKALEALLYKYSDIVISIADYEAYELGRVPDDDYILFNLRPKEDQLIKFNELFGNINYQLNQRKIALAKYIEKNITNYTNNKRYIEIPNGIISSFV